MPLNKRVVSEVTKQNLCWHPVLAEGSSSKENFADRCLCDVFCSPFVFIQIERPCCHHLSTRSEGVVVYRMVLTWLL
jgi:hypothetical protein